MRYALTVLLPALLLLPPALAQDAPGEKLYRQIEKTIKAADAVKAASDIVAQGKVGMDQTLKTVLLMTRDNKARIVISGQELGKEFKLEITSDGKQMHIEMMPFG